MTVPVPGWAMAGLDGEPVAFRVVRRVPSSVHTSKVRRMSFYFYRHPQGGKIYSSHPCPWYA